MTSVVVVLAAFLPAAAASTATLVVTNTNDSGPGSLRQALDDANADPAANTIAFHIPTIDLAFNGQWFTIRPLSELPLLTDDGTTIDGSTQTAFTGDTNPAGPEIELSGSLAGPGPGLTVFAADSRIDSLAITGFRAGIRVEGDRNIVQRSHVGANPAGSVAGNTGAGIIIKFGFEGPVPTVVRNNAILGNLIAGNGSAGIDLAGADDSLIQGNRIEGNGFSISVGCAFGCGGIVVGDGNPYGFLTNGTVIGGTGPGEGNVISGNGNAGIEMRNAGTETRIQGNLIGTNASGNAANGNRFAGIAAQGTGTLIGGTAPGARNVISGNGATGVVAAGTGTVVQGNYIGTTTAGTAALPNGEDGVLVAFGGGATVLGNVISNNGRFGVFVRSSGTRVEANTVASNVSAGVVVSSFAGTGNPITRNSIFGNGELGIELAPLGVNPNDPRDADTGPNNLQNYPVLTRAIAAGGRLVVQGEIDTPNPESVVIEFFANAVPVPGGDPSGHGEGAVFLGTVTPNVHGRFVAALPPVAEGTLITATATDAVGNTSEFAANVTAFGPGPP